MKHVLILCTGNSCRSQMAQAYGNALNNKNLTFHSAGTKSSTINPYAKKVLAEDGLSLDGHWSKTVDEVKEQIDVVITVCDHAAKNCPIFPAGQTLHKPFPDPPELTAHESDEEKKLLVYRNVRDSIKEYIQSLEVSLNEGL